MRFLSRKECALTQLFYWHKEHISGFVSAEAAAGKPESAVGLPNIVRTGVSEKFGSAINGPRSAFQFKERANGSLIELNLQVADAWQSVCGPEFFVTEQWPQSQSNQDEPHLFPVSDGDFDFFSYLVSSRLPQFAERGLRAAQRLRRALVGERGLDGPQSIFPATVRTWPLDSDSNELAAPGQILLRGVIERVGFVGAWARLPGTELLQAMPQCGNIRDA